MKLRTIGLTILFTLTAFVIGALLMNFVIMPAIIHQRSGVFVPDVRGMSEQQARHALEGMNLHLRIDRTQNDEELPRGYVITQRPRPNESVKEGRTVGVALSLGPHMQRVPELQNTSLRQGSLTLARQKLQTGRVARVLREDGLTEGNRETVIGSAPGPGREVTEGTAVDLLVAVGGQPQRYYMPDLTGQDLLFIREKLENAGFRIGNVRYEKRDGVYPNTIIDQLPKPGSMIRLGDSIELVAAGSE